MSERHPHVPRQHVPHRKHRRSPPTLVPVHPGALASADSACKIICLAALAIGLQAATTLTGLVAAAGVGALALAVHAKNARFIGFVLGPFSLLLAATSALQYFTAQLSIHDTLAYSLRLLTLAVFSLLFVVTTRLGDILFGVDRLLWPLRVLGVPTRYISLGMALSVQFLQMFVGAHRDIVKAREARGLHTSGLRGIRAVAVPLLLKVGRIVADVADSLRLRHVNFHDPTILRLRPVSWRATVLMFFASGLIIAAGLFL